MKTNGAGRREHQEEIRGARASGWTEAIRTGGACSSRSCWKAGWAIVGRIV